MIIARIELDQHLGEVSEWMWGDHVFSMREGCVLFLSMD